MSIYHTSDSHSRTQIIRYLAILRRFWVLVVVLPLLVGGASLARSLMQPPQYGSTARVLVTQTPHGTGGSIELPDLNLNYSWESSEFILDDLPQVLQSTTFAQDVREWLAQQGNNLDIATIRNGLDAENFHRTVTIVSAADTPDTAAHLLEGAIACLQKNGLRYWQRLPSGNAGNGSGLSVATLDPPAPAHRLNGLRPALLNGAMRAGLALAAAVGLAFLLHFLDDRLREPHQAEEWVGVPVVGVIPTTSDEK